MSHSQWQAYEILSEKFEDAQFFYATNNEIKSKLGVDSKDVVTIFNKHEVDKIDYSGEFDQTRLTNSLRQHLASPIIPFTAKLGMEIFQGNGEVLVLITRNDEAGAKAKEALESASGLKEKILITHATVDNADGKRLVEFIGVERSDLPLIMILSIVPGTPIKYEYKGEITPHGIFDFYSSYTTKQLFPNLSFRSQPVPETQDGPVYVVVGENFGQVVLDETKDVLLELYSPSCGHCKKFTPLYEQIAKKTQNVKNLVIAKMNAIDNMVTGHLTSEYPTIRFYPAKDKTNPLEYKGGRDPQTIIEWLKANAKHAQWTGGEL